MDWRLPALAIGLFVLGAALLVAPLEPGPTSVVTLDSGQRLDLSVPAVDSLAGAEVNVSLSWGHVAPPCCDGLFCPSCFPNPPTQNRTFLLVLDCGPQACQNGGNYSAVGRSAGGTGGHTNFAEIPGHHYQVWLFSTNNSTSVLFVPVRYSLEFPLLGGAVGAVCFGGESLLS